MTKTKKPAAKAAKKPVAKKSKSTKAPTQTRDAIGAQPAGTATALSIATTKKLDTQSLQLASRADEVAAKAELLVIKDTETLQTASTMLVQLKEAKDSVKARRDLIVKPIKDHVAVLEGLFRGPMQKLEHADVTIRQKVIKYREEERERAAAEQQRLMDEARKAEEKAEALAEEGKGKAAAKAQEEAQALAVEAVNVSAPTRVIETGIGTNISTKQVWDFEIQDPSALPREYLMPNEGAIRKAIQSGIRNIDGVRVFQKEQLAVGGR